MSHQTEKGKVATTINARSDGARERREIKGGGEGKKKRRVVIFEGSEIVKEVQSTAYRARDTPNCIGCALDSTFRSNVALGGCTF